MIRIAIILNIEKILFFLDKIEKDRSSSENYKNRYPT